MDHSPGSFADSLVTITETFTAASGDTIYATEDYRIWGYDEETGHYEAHEEGKDWPVLLTDDQLRGRCYRIHPDGSPA